MQSVLILAAVSMLGCRGQTASVATTTAAAATAYVQRQSAPPCYPTIRTINSAMRTERTRIQNGGIPEGTYEFVLCPNTVFDATFEALQPTLDNVVFRCGGATSVAANRCIFNGGAQQVLILDSLVPGYFLQQVSFVGITFSNFGSTTEESTSIAAFASSITTALFRDCVWEVGRQSQEA